MAVITVPMANTLIPNTTMCEKYIDDVLKGYSITPNSGYVLHDKGMDEEVIDPETMLPTGEIKLGYRTSTATCAANYDFTANPREFYTVLESEVPADQIYNNPDKPEVM